METPPSDDDHDFEIEEEDVEMEDEPNALDELTRLLGL